ncbi:hypothetical protein CANINC_001484 [Pichia inconspicua]|uniref:Zn(2)-C6 fungal-type domain-containing protein n=1 Tax=Pichia inconspicua TaxID=52247 RepID=A0A4T0X423_9ASCO|nr:hypothetical protein CANINC_001484 [[Candida] inconspicua]
MFLQPDDIKSCANCKMKKVKCSAEIPQCARCVKSGIQCNIADNVYYNHKTVRSLLDVIVRLEHEVALQKASINTSNEKHFNNNGYQLNTNPNSNIKRNNINNNNDNSNNGNQVNKSSNHPGYQNLQQTQQQQQQQQDSNLNLERKSISSTPKFFSPGSLAGGNASTTNSSLASGGKEKSNNKSTIESISAEVGSLTLPNIEHNFGLQPEGSKFSHLLLKQLSLHKQGRSLKGADDAFESFDASVTKAYIPLPPYRVAKFAVLMYINNVHVFCPFLSVTELKNILEKMYCSPREVSSHDKFILFLILSIGLDRGQNSPEMANYKNQFDPVEYYNTAYRYFEEILTIRSEKTLQALLLTIIWMLHSSIVPNNIGEMWHLGRFSLSLAMELGCHRYNPDWDFGELKNELRNRLFWSTYVLERSIAMFLKRGVSLRKQAIDTPLPKVFSFDFIADDNFFVSKELKLYEKLQLKPALLTIKICEVYGDILETLYLTSGSGPREFESLEERISFKERTHSFLENWMAQVEKEIPRRTQIYHELKIRYGITSLNLHRQTPGLPKSNDHSILICKQQCESCIDSYIWLLQDGWKLTPILVNDIVDIGLLVVFSCWRLDANSENLKNMSIKLMKIMNEIVRFFPDFTKFKNLYIILSCIIIDELDSPNTDHSSDGLRARIDKLRATTYYLPAMSDNGDVQSSSGKKFYADNGVKLNDSFSHELFEDVFRQYYFKVDDPIMKEIGNLFCID